MFHHDILVIKIRFYDDTEYSLEATSTIVINNTEFGKNIKYFRPSEYKLYPNTGESKTQT